MILLLNRLRRKALMNIWRMITFDEVSVLAQTLPYHRDSGVVLDIGGHHGSSAEAFLSRGWRVISVEPDAQNRKRLQRLRTLYSNRHVIDPRAASSVSGRRLQLYTSVVSTGISSVVPFHPSHVPSQLVTTVTVADLVSEHQVAAIEVLKVDVEGHELPVLAGTDWHGMRPSAVLVEFDETKRGGTSLRNLLSFLRQEGYDCVICEWRPVSEYGAHHRPWAIADTDATVAESAWGNVVAFTDGGMADAFRVRARRRLRFARRLRFIAHLVRSARFGLKRLRPSGRC